MAKARTKRRGNADSLRQYREQKAAEEAQVAQATEEGVEVNEIRLTGDMAGLLTVLQQAQQAQDADSALNQIKDALGKLDEKTLRQIVATPLVEELVGKLAAASDNPLRPGEYLYDNEGRVIKKIPWSAQDVKDNYPMVKWTPLETMVITFNGHSIQVYAMQEIETPCIFETIYKQHLEATQRIGAENEAAMRANFGNDISIIVGWHPQEARA